MLRQNIFLFTLSGEIDSPDLFTWAMRSALGAVSHALLFLPGLHGRLVGVIVKKSGVESGTKTSPATGSCLGVCSGWVDRGR